MKNLFVLAWSRLPRYVKMSHQSVQRKIPMLSFQRSIGALAVAVTLFMWLQGDFVFAADDGIGPSADDSVWHYQAEVDDLRPIARSISFSKDRPQDLVEEIEYRSTQRLYGQLRYGSENSRRVVIVVDELNDVEYKFYVDADRDRRITKDDLVTGTGRTRTCPLVAEIIRADQPFQGERQVLLRLGATRTRISLATLGCIEGEIAWPGASAENSSGIRVRRIDGNANGLFSDSRDRLMLDINNDGHWDRVSEQFAYLPVQNLLGRRYAVHSDRMAKTRGLAVISYAVKDDHPAKATLESHRQLTDTGPNQYRQSNHQ
jgi:hypothetical protein